MTDAQTFVSPAAAKQFWAKHAYEALAEVAGRYDAVLTISELAEEVQRRSNLWTKAPVHTWVTPLLTDLAKVSHVRGEPPLTSLVVHKDDGRTNSGYDEVLRLAGAGPFDDPVERETHAAASRLECYRHWGADVPDDAQPRITLRVRERQERAATGSTVRAATTRSTTRIPEPRRGAVCPTCFVEMPVSGICVNCAD